MSSSDQDLATPSANERLKDAWRIWLRRSTALAAAAHLALFAFSFTWQIPYKPLEPIDVDSGRLLLLPGFGEASGPGSTVAGRDSVPGDLTEVEAEAEAGLTEGPVVMDADFGETWETLGERLRGRGAPLPTLAEPEIVPPEEEVEEDVAAADAPATDQQEGVPSIGADARTTELADLPEPDSLSLDRLSALRPELAFMTASAWVLIRNQTEVEAFLRRSYNSGRLSPDARGSVSVTLWIDRRGSVEWAEVSSSSGRNDLDEFTLALFNEVAAFRAAREQGVYVSRSVTFSVNYPW
jgi:TonB family protein